ncbi:hypothetical protein ElyMa_002123000 [Elysia marginata]|uniref:Uncharacterized protein n=1 Tax=Elysia marginata TaxID=1093978 RepID=A0AAV4FIW7_9GAST|nr:hypothetical protein ElyMa_002123000 [Elysia marginata]
MVRNRAPPVPITVIATPVRGATIRGRADSAWKGFIQVDLSASSINHTYTGNTRDWKDKNIIALIPIPTGKMGQDGRAGEVWMEVWKKQTDMYRNEKRLQMLTS